MVHKKTPNLKPTGPEQTLAIRDNFAAAAKAS